MASLAARLRITKWLPRSSRILTQSRAFLSTNMTSVQGTLKTGSSILGEHRDEEDLAEERLLDRHEKLAAGAMDDFAGVRGHSAVIDKADFAHARIGDVVEIPYEITASDFWRELWQSVFYQQDRIHTSYAYVSAMKSDEQTKVGVVHTLPRGIPMPFSAMLYAATSMSHVDDTRNVLDLAFRNCVYERCVFPNDTLTRHFVIENIRESSNGKNILVDLRCKMYNQHNELVFRVDKTMFFEKLKLVLDGRQDIVKLSQSSKKGIAPVIDTRCNETSTFKRYLVKQGSKSNSLNAINPYSIKQLYTSELLLHTLQRPIGMETNMNLSMLFRMTHPLLYNTNRYRDPNELYVGGVLLVALTHSIASKELYEVVYEELLDTHIINKASPNDCISAMTYIIDVNDSKYEYFQEVECITIGLKNVDIVNQLNNVKIPLSLFRPGIFPRDVENICNKFIPQLQNKIVLQSYRKLLRQKPKHDTMIPLL